MSSIELTYIYGKHAVAEALALRPDLFKEVYIDASFTDASILAMLERARVTPRLLGKRLPGGLRNDAVHQGIIAGIDVSKLVLDYKTFMATESPTADTAYLVLGELQDPHNVGAVIRSAAAFGIRAVFIPPHNQAPVNGTVIKVSVGMAFKIPLVEIRNVNATLDDMKKRGCWIYGLAGETGAIPLPDERFTKPSVFVLGNEGAGLRQKTREHCDTLLSIPMHPRTESLNAAASAAVVMYAWSTEHTAALSPLGLSGHD